MLNKVLEQNAGLDTHVERLVWVDNQAREEMLLVKQKSASLTRMVDSPDETAESRSAREIKMTAEKARVGGTADR